MSEEVTTDTKIHKIEDSLDREVLKSLTVTGNGSIVENYNQLLDIAKTMSMSKHGIPKHLRGNPGDCLAIREIAMDKGLSPYGLARHCYVVNDLLCFDGQAVHAIVEKSGRLAEPLDFDYAGEGDSRTCTVTGKLKGAATARSYTTPPIAKITPQNSPLWKTDPDQQLAYLAVRRWAGRFCPAALLGIYSREEMMDSMIDVTPEPAQSPKLMERLPGRVEGDGFAETTAEAAQEEAQALNQAEQVRQQRADSLKKAREAKANRASAGGRRARSKAKGVGEAAPAPKATVRAPQGQPAAMSKAGYVEWAQAMIKAEGRQAVNWFLSGEQAKLRQACKVDDQTATMLLTLAKEARGES